MSDHERELRDLERRVASLSDEFRELREGMQRALLIAEQDPEMALTRARKVLEQIVREVFVARCAEDPGTRPLENLIQRLVKDGHMPTLVEAYASTVRKLGNVGTHAFGESISREDVARSLAQLLLILDWYFTMKGPAAPAGTSSANAAREARAPLPPSRRGRRGMVAGIGILAVAGVAGVLFARGRSSAAPSAGPVTVWIRPETHRDSTTTAFGSGATLHSGDRFAMKVWVDQPARVWVVSCSAAKHLSLLYTTPASKDLAVGSAARIPREDDGWFELDTNVGQETLYVVASRATLADADPDVARTIERLAEGDLTCAPDGPPEASLGAATKPLVAAPTQAPVTHRPDDAPLMIASREVKLVSAGGDEGGRSMCQVASGGLAICKLSFKHE
jgi:hypothetical protein